MRVVRELQERTGGFTEFVPLVRPLPTLLGRTHGIGRISREENLKHTAGLGWRSATRSERPGQLGEDGPRRRHRGAALGVNDLGGTLMEESISRMAGAEHGVVLTPDQLIAAAHRAGRPAAERTTLYEIRRRHELPLAA